MNIYHKSAITPLLVELFFQQKPFGSNLACFGKIISPTGHSHFPPQCFAPVGW